jgi:hypothetical protein
VTLAVTTPLVDVRTLSFTSFAVTVIDVWLPAVPAGTDAVVCAALAAPVTTLNAFDDPDEPFVAVNVKEPVFVIVTECELSTPLVNAAVAPLPALNVAPAAAIVTVLLKFVTVLLLASCAVMRIVNGVPAVCVSTLPPADASTLKWLTAPKPTTLEYGLPEIAVPDCVIVMASVPAAVGVYVAEQVAPLDTEGEAVLAPETVTTNVAALAALHVARLLPFTSFGRIVMVVTEPAVPDGTVATVCAASIVPTLITTVAAAVVKLCPLSFPDTVAEPLVVVDSVAV